MASPGSSIDFGAMPEDELSRQWCAAGQEYAAAANASLEMMRRQKGVIDGPEPIDRRKPMARFVLDAVRRANAAGDLSGLRLRFPPAHGPFVEMLDENGKKPARGAAPRRWANPRADR
jgi:hypothetical protein